MCYFFYAGGFEGAGVSEGKATGRVVVVKEAGDYSSFKSGDILVTEITNPTMVPMMAKASAIVCNIGGMTSHPSIISRELGIPCVVAAKNATSVLKNGMVVEVDGKKGEVRIVSGK